MLANSDEIEQVLVNIVSNAIKFTPPGGEIMLTVDVDAQNVTTLVRDTGSAFSKTCPAFSSVSIGLTKPAHARWVEPVWA